MVQTIEQLELWLEVERDQLALWMPVMFGTGIGLWFATSTSEAWIAIMITGLGAMFAGVSFGFKRRIARSAFWAGLCLASGCGLIWLRSEWVAESRIERPTIAIFIARIERIDAQPQRNGVRLLLATGSHANLPPHVRVSVDSDKSLVDLIDGEQIVVRARLVPPPDAAVPGGYDFARAAWFQRIGGTGKALDKLRRVGPIPNDGQSLRARITAHVRERLDGSAGGIAAAFATGDRGGIAPEDEDAMRASGLTHLLSISGLHITAVVAAAMFMALRLLALSPWLALRAPLVIVSAGIGALAGIGYTLLTGAEVPTIRSCIAALLVLIGLALGREALTLRLVATGALIVLLIWPEVLVGASFQLSFAAITAIVALHEHPRIQAALMRRDDALIMRLARSLSSLLLTGVMVELTLAPIALYHFHKSGLYGALANIVAIPLTTFIVMPLEASALLLDAIGLGAPFWWATGISLEFLLWITRHVASLPGAVMTLPSIPTPAFAAVLGGALWILLWRTRPRWFGFVPFVSGIVVSMATPAPDLLVTGDGRHLAIRGNDGKVALLRTRTGDYMRDLLAERSGELDPPIDLDFAHGARCGRDLCLATLNRGGRSWRIAATRSPYRLPWAAFAETCRSVDIIVSDRYLPRGCKPRWLKLDKAFLLKTGGLAINLSAPQVESVFHLRDDHPWKKGRQMISSAAKVPRADPARAPGSAHSVVAGRPGSQDRGGSLTLRGGNI